MATATIGAVKRPPQEILDDAEAMVEGACVGRQSICVRAEIRCQGLHLSAVQCLPGDQKIVQIKSGSPLCPGIKSAKGSEITYEGGRLDSVTPVPDRPASGHSNRQPSCRFYQARQALTAIENYPEYGERSLYL